jgi:hypothetical protein
MEARTELPSPGVAAALSVVPGLGQLFNRQPGRALYFLGGTVLCLGGSIALITGGERLGRSLLGAHAFVPFLLLALLSVVVFLALFVTGLFLWGSAAVDARLTALARQAGTEPGHRWWLLQL